MLNNAADAGANNVTLLGPGNFIIGTAGNGSYLGLTNNLTLRGSGAGVTFLRKPNGGWPRSTSTVSGTNGIFAPFGQPIGGWDQFPIIQIAPGAFPGIDDTTSQNLTVDGNRGDFSITLDGSSAWTFAPGQFVLLDELSLSSWNAVPAGFGCTDNATPTPCPPFVWSGDKFASNIHWPIQLFQDDASNSDSNAPFDAITTFTGSISGNVMTTTGSPALVEGSRLFGSGLAPLSALVRGSANTWRVVPAQTVASTTISAYNTASSFFGFSRIDRAGCEIKEIINVVGNTITFNSPLSWPYRVSHGAQLTAYTNAGNGGVTVQLTGIEELTMVGGGNGNLRFANAAYCWARNVESTLWVNEGFARTNTFRIEIRDSYSHTASFPTPCGGGYSMSGANGDSECLIENNIILDANKMMVFRSCGAGAVVAYNYADDGWISFNTTFTEIGMNASHLGGSHHVLMEGNICFNADSDFTHGATTYSTHFRNWYTGQRRDFTDSVQRMFGASSYAWNHSFIGNVGGYSSKPSWIWSGGAAATNPANGWVITEPNMNCDVNGGNCTGGGTASWFQSPDAWAVGYDPERFGPPAQTSEPITLASLIRDGNWDWVSGAQHWYTTPGTFAIPNSMYLSSSPAFFSTYVDTWPIVNPATGATFVNPALHRYNNGTPNAP